METVLSYIEQGVKYKVINWKKTYDRPYLVKSSSEINMLAISMKNIFGLLYTTLLVNFNRQKLAYNAVSCCAVNLTFRRLKPKIKENQKIK